MHKSATKCNKTIGKWCKNKHGASKIIDTFETYQPPDGKNLNTRSVFQNTSRSAAAVDPKIGRVQKLFPAPCRRGESPPEVFFITMLAFGAMSE
jgi:hypothetical protein